MDKKAKAILMSPKGKGTFVPKVCDKFQRKVYQEFDKLVDSGIANEKEIVSYLGKLDGIEKDRKDPKAVKIYLEWIKEGAKHKEEGLERKGKLWDFLTCYESFKVKDAGVEETLKKKSEGGKRRKRTKKSGGSWESARKKERKKYCKKYYKGKYGIDKKGCKKDPKCVYRDMGSGGEWCYTKKRTYKKRRKRNLKKRTRRRRHRKRRRRR